MFSLVFLYGTILMYPELCYCSSILWCFSPLLSCDELSFPLWSYLIGLSLYENTWCMSCLDNLWWQWDIMCHLMYVLVINLRVPPMNLCIGVGTRFRLDSLVETLGHSLKYFVLVGWIWECVMHIVQSCPRILEVTMEYLGDIRVLVDLCLKVLF